MTDTNTPVSVVEDVARAICRRTAEINWEDGSLKDVTAWENETPGTREHFRDLAKAALAAQPRDDVRELLSIKAMLDALLCERWATAWQTDVVRRLKAARDRLTSLATTTQPRDEAKWGWIFEGPDGEWHWSAEWCDHEGALDQRPATAAEAEFVARINAALSKQPDNELADAADSEPSGLADEMEALAQRCQNARHSAAGAEERDNALRDAALALRQVACTDRKAVLEEAVEWPRGTRVTKIKGSNWTGKIVGFYSTNLTPEGYAIESETEIGSVQIYPRAALRLASAEGV